MRNERSTRVFINFEHVCTDGHTLSCCWPAARDTLLATFIIFAPLPSLCRNSVPVLKYSSNLMNWPVALDLSLSINSLNWAVSHWIHATFVAMASQLNEAIFRTLFICIASWLLLGTLVLWCLFLICTIHNFCLRTRMALLLRYFVCQWWQHLKFTELKEEVEPVNGLHKTTSGDLSETVKNRTGDQSLEELCEQFCEELQEMRKEAGRPEDLRVRVFSVSWHHADLRLLNLISC